ncbi:zf-DNL-domain-containing protein [Aspergillus taichungensis]|uniref:Zf-DNL-domain-containing protein n=1 Tax=Aspergillus taichungensis TaxID=482145 RepID=A0A2J5HDZ7_9EURO|nr:zf-DNL-domain-containing protein [Aspergillus taichungensis]
MRPAMPLSQGLRLISSLPRSTISRNAARPLSHLAFRSLRPSPVPSQRLATRITIPSIGSIRANSSSSSSSSETGERPLTDRTSDPATDAEYEKANRLRREQEPAYQITFTCKPCNERSSHRMSKHGYHRGTVVIRCPSCRNRHVISDHLNIFLDQKSTLDDILAKQGDKLTRGYVEGDMEFWDDGSSTPRSQSESGSEGSSGSSDGQGKLG